eukprot:TRINITY_DN14862_c0_g1_i1.p1 TRINITY_DN14862_c0_g1~~TRINITY_DN14862_c0_g1_i1.p1  ORF type:complete len:805 (-),score=141.47 TRINITY_DN14862_c0_g1_i1:151-2448(-)
MGRKKALCVGLNYPKNQKYQIYGCVNDCLNWEYLLKETFGFDETRVLIDQHPDGSHATAATQIPTRDNILAQLGWLCSTAEPGDCLAFVFAGHGCQVSRGDGTVEQALVPEDFAQLDEHGSPRLVMDDELHALLQRLPAGSFITIIMDCCHGTSVLDVPCCVDSSTVPPRISQTSEPPREAPDQTEDGWHRSVVPHAQGRPRFIPTVRAAGPARQRRIQPGMGAHLGRMTLDPGVTAFCFAASRPAEAALDANIKSHQQGVMSFCLQEALAQLKNRCTYTDLLNKAAAKMSDIREKYMPTMDQHIQLSFCPNSPPSEVVVLDKAYATVAQHVLYKRAKEERERAQMPPVSADNGNDRRMPNREASSDFVPSPAYQVGAMAAAAAAAPAPGVPGQAHVRVTVRRALRLRNTDSGIFGNKSDPFVVVKLGSQEKRTPTINDNLDPTWTEQNTFVFNMGEHEHKLEFAVVNANYVKNDVLGRTALNLQGIPRGQTQHRRDRLEDGGGAELEYEVVVDGPPISPSAGAPGPCSPCSPCASSSFRGEFGGGPPREPPAPAALAADALGMSMRRPPEPGFPPSDVGAAAGETPNIFGQPNLFGQVPNLLGLLNSGGAGARGDAATSARPCLGGAPGTAGAAGAGSARAPGGVAAGTGMTQAGVPMPLGGAFPTATMAGGARASTNGFGFSAGAPALGALGAFGGRVPSVQGASPALAPGATALPTAAPAAAVYASAAARTQGMPRASYAQPAVPSYQPPFPAAGYSPGMRR